MSNKIPLLLVIMGLLGGCVTTSETSNDDYVRDAYLMWQLQAIQSREPEIRREWASLNQDDRIAFQKVFSKYEVARNSPRMLFLANTSAADGELYLIREKNAELGDTLLYETFHALSQYMHTSKQYMQPAVDALMDMLKNAMRGADGKE